MSDLRFRVRCASFRVSLGDMLGIFIDSVNGFWCKHTWIDIVWARSRIVCCQTINYHFHFTLGDRVRFVKSPKAKTYISRFSGVRSEQRKIEIPQRRRKTKRKSAKWNQNQLSPKTKITINAWCGLSDAIKDINESQPAHVRAYRHTSLNIRLALESHTHTHFSHVDSRSQLDRINSLWLHAGWEVSVSEYNSACG